ncbi:hypothetical protein [Rubidibacter lacunae]|uniref:hypothetical protein n=1 Tax=Rubidibacter lacunae TaxID=582514 RepID=UPI00040A19E7|nr:hypothetical protein [Rubidibacter lacunae]
MEYIFFLANASLTLRLVRHLNREVSSLPPCSLTVIHRIDGWLVKIKFDTQLAPMQAGNFRAYLSEIGIPFEPDIRLQMAFWSLETGQSPVDVMRRYQLAIVAHGYPDRQEIETFCQQFTRGLGYCPETLA